MSPRAQLVRYYDRVRALQYYEEVTDLSSTFDRPREEVTGKSGAPDHLDMLRWSVVSADKLATNRVVSCRCNGNWGTTRHDTTRPTFSVRLARQPITLDCYHNIISDVTICT